MTIQTVSSLTASNLSKSFPGVVALDGVSLEVFGGTIHALVGANGAGKSTLIKILTGFYSTYEGQIEINGRPVSIGKPTDAIQLGIEVVHQEVDTVLVPYLSVAENLSLEQLAQKRRSPWVRWRTLYAQARQMTARIGLEVDVRRTVESLSLHEKQMLVIARAFSHNVKYLILDEPTASLSLPEVDRLFGVLRELKATGVGIIYISHRLGEVRQIADEISILRNGRKVAHFPMNAESTPVHIAQISEAMLGVQPKDAFPPRSVRSPGSVVLEAKGLTRRGHVRGVDLTVRKGEIVGIAGLVGAGKTELLRLLFGADTLDGGGIWINARPVKLRTPKDAIEHGIYLVPEERRKQGLHVEDPVRTNITLPFLRAYSALGWLLRAQERKHSQGVVKQIGLNPPLPEVLVRTLSGGNQQKVVIGKWVGQTGERAAKLLLFDEATQGIDIKAKRDVYELVQQLSIEAAVIYASSDIDEVLALADRVLVMRDGRVVADLDGHSADRQEVLVLATGSML